MKASLRGQKSDWIKAHEDWVLTRHVIIFNVYLITGGSFPFTVGRIEHGHRVRPDLCAVDNQFSPRKYLGSFYTDSLVHDPVALKLLIDVIGKVSNCSQCF